MTLPDNKKSTLLISYKKRIEYDETDVFVNSAKIDNLANKSSEEFAINAMRDYYTSFLRNHFENLIVLTGAGSSIGVGVGGKTGKTRAGLWASVKTKIEEDVLQKFCKSVNHPYPADDEIGDLEEILSKAYNAKKFFDGDSRKHLVEVISNIEKILVEECSLSLPRNSPHEMLLDKLTARKVKLPRVKIFTLNYDTLFEQAAQRGAYLVIDGFSFSLPREFNGQYFSYDVVVRENSRIQNEENYVPHVFHLYKPHGSLDWEKNDSKVIKNDKTRNPLIIYPKDSKYESSYDQPFFEMVSRFQQYLRLNNVLLIVIGFSFYDKHIRTMILEAVKVNPSFRLLIVTTDIQENLYLEPYREIAGFQNNVILVNEEFSNFTKQIPYPETYRDVSIRIKKEDLEIEPEN